MAMAFKNSVTFAYQLLSSALLLLHTNKTPDAQTACHSGLVYQKRRASSEWKWERGIEERAGGFVASCTRVGADRRALNAGLVHASCFVWVCHSGCWSENAAESPWRPQLWRWVYKQIGGLFSPCYCIHTTCPQTPLLTLTHTRLPTCPLSILLPLSLCLRVWPVLQVRCSWGFQWNSTCLLNQ